MSEKPVGFRTTIAPWLSVQGGAKAVAFYKAAFGAVETYHMEDPDGNVVARLSVGSGEFWLSEGLPEMGSGGPQAAGGPPVRMILTVEDPDAVYASAVAAGAIVVYPVIEEHGWRVGRVVDPFGHHWEIAREMAG